MIVPTYRESVGTDGPQQGPLAIHPVGEGVSGVDVNRAEEGIGKQAEALGGQLERHLLYLERQRSQEKVSDLVSGAIKQIQDRAQNEHGTGWLQKEGANARGILHGPTEYGKTYALNDESFDGFFAGLKKDTLEGLNSAEAKQADRMLNREGQVWRNRIITHETTQSKIAHDTSLDARIGGMADTASMASASKPEDFIDQVKAAKDLLRERHPGEDEATYTALDQKFAAGAMAKFQEANPYLSPEELQNMLDGAKSFLHPADIGKLQKPIDGKWIDFRTQAIRAHIATDTSGPGETNRFKEPDGTYNIAAVEGEAMRLTSSLKEGEHGYKKGEEVHQAKEAKSFAVMQNGALKDGWDKGAKGFLDSILSQQQQNKGILFQDAEKNAISQFASQVHPGDLQKLRDSAAKSWLGDPEGPKMRLKLMMTNDDLAAGYKDAKRMIEDKFTGNTQPVKDNRRIMLQILDKTAPGFRSGKQIREWMTDQLEPVPTANPWWGMGYFGQHQKEKALAEHDLIQKYGQEKVDAAQAATGP